MRSATIDERKEVGPDCHWPVTFNYNTSGANDTYRRTNILFTAIRKHSSRLLSRLRRIMAKNEEPSTSDTDSSASMSPTRHFQIQLETDSPRPSENLKETLPHQLPRFPSDDPNKPTYEMADQIARLQEVHEASKAQRRQEQEQQEQSSSSISSPPTVNQAPTNNSYMGHRRLTNAEWNRDGQHGPFFTAEDQPGSNLPPNRRLTNAEWNISGVHGPFFTAEDQPGKNVTPTEPSSSAQSKEGARDEGVVRDGQIWFDQNTSKNQEHSQEEGK